MNRSRVVLFTLLSVAGSTSGFCSTETTHLECLPSAQNYQLYNATTQTKIGEPVQSLSICNRLLDTKRITFGMSSVCAATKNQGFTITRADNAAVLGSKDDSWSTLNTCELAIQASRNGVVCTPNKNGASIFDLKHNRALKSAPYQKNEDCRFATSYSTEKHVCAPHLNHQNLIYIYNRELNGLESRYQAAFSSAIFCGDFLFYDEDDSRIQ